MPDHAPRAGTKICRGPFEPAWHHVEARHHRSYELGQRDDCVTDEERDVRRGNAKLAEELSQGNRDDHGRNQDWEHENEAERGCSWKAAARKRYRGRST